MEKQEIYIRSFEQEMTHHHTTVLRYQIQYPAFQFRRYPENANKANLYYRMQAQALRERIRNLMYPDAVSQYLKDRRDGLPIMVYQVEQRVTPTYNENCTLSLYQDQYSFTGGAHGNTVRSAANWNVQAGKMRELSEFFPPGFDWRGYIIKTISQQIQRHRQSDDKRAVDAVQTAFNPASFYLKDRGIVVFYQQYDIAPYVQDIPEFFIPFEPGRAKAPSCRQQQAWIRG